MPRKMAVLSNKPVNPSRAIVESLGLGQYFSQVYGGNSFATKKPEPEGALKLVSEAGMQPEQAAIVGDSHVDIRTGRNAGLWTVAVTYGFAPHTLEAESSDVVVDTPRELGKYSVKEVELPPRNPGLLTHNNNRNARRQMTLTTSGFTDKRTAQAAQPEESLRHSEVPR